jgi:DNA repair protein RadD
VITPTLRPNQSEAVDAVFDGFRAGLLRPLIDACVASGKSLTIAEIGRIAATFGWRVLVLSHVRELVEQVAAAGMSVGLQVGVNAASLDRRDWRGQFIVAAIQSVFRNARSFGPIDLLIIDECHLIPHGEMGMYRALIRDLGVERVVGLSGTVFRLHGGSLVDGEGALFQKVVFRYSIIDGIRDGLLVPAFSVTVDDKIDPAKLKISQGEYTGSSQDAQMIALMDSHLMQLLHIGRDRRRWLVFEASTKAAKAMTERMNAWGIPTGLVLGTTPAGERAATIAAYRAGRLRALVNCMALTTGFDVQEVDMLVMRRRTTSLGLYVQMIGRGLRTIGGNIEESIRRGKSDCLVCDYADNISTHGALDFLRPKDTKVSLVSCESCGKRNAAAAAKCWSCSEPMTKLCPACLVPVVKGTLDCPHCDHDMRTGGAGEARKPQALLETPSGAALIASYKSGAERAGGWLPIRRAWEKDGVATVAGLEGAWPLPEALAALGADARWVRLDAAGEVGGILVPNGSSRTSIRQYGADGSMLLVPMPSQKEAENTC